jgi:sugar lactone lactonase YvrE
MTELLWDCRCTVGESPIWDPVRRRVWFTDIPAGRLHAWSVDSAARTVWDLRDGAAPATLASIGLCRSGRLVLALRDRVVLFHPGSGEMQDLTASFGLPARVRLNDGKVGPDGAFWVGSMDMGEPVDHPDQLPLGTLFRVAPDGTVTRAVEEVTISNGLAWSPDGRTMYYADTHGVWIDAIAFDPATGALGERRRLVAPDEGAGRADGGATDSEGGAEPLVRRRRAAGPAADARVVPHRPVLHREWPGLPHQPAPGRRHRHGIGRPVPAEPGRGRQPGRTVRRLKPSCSRRTSAWPTLPANSSC